MDKKFYNVKVNANNTSDFQGHHRYSTDTSGIMKFLLMFQSLELESREDENFLNKFDKKIDCCLSVLDIF